MREQLIQVQMQEFPDSKIVDMKEVLSWMYEKPYDLEQTLAHWERLHGPIYSQSIDRGLAKGAYMEKIVLEHQISVSRKVAVALANEHELLWYVCGRRADGSYNYRGARFGVKPSEYISGFGK